MTIVLRAPFALTAIVMVIRTGHLGAKLAWAGEEGRPPPVLLPAIGSDASARAEDRVEFVVARLTADVVLCVHDTPTIAKLRHGTLNLQPWTETH